jgi:hypothetical protein
VKRSFQLVLALVVAVAGFGLAAAPSAAVAPPPAKAFVTTAAPATSVWSQSVKLTAAITPKGGGAPKGGTVTFLSDGVPVGTAVATTRNTTLTTNTLPPGTHVITAEYSGDVKTAPSTSTGSTTITVGAAPTAVSLRATQDPVPYEDRAEIKATVTAVAPAVTTRRPSGTVTFYVDGCLSATVNLNANGVATWRPWLCPGERSITAVYEGSERHAGSETATPLELTVLDPDGGPGEDEENVDQVNEGMPSGLLEIYDTGETSRRYAQTITASRTGRIYAVDLVGLWYTEDETPPSDLRISVQTLDEDGNPTGSILGYGSLLVADSEGGVGGQFHVELDSQADVEGGLSYALVLEVDPQTPEAHGRWLLAATGEDSYPLPLLGQADGGEWLVEDVGMDLFFRTHLGDPV